MTLARSLASSQAYTENNTANYLSVMELNSCPSSDLSVSYHNKDLNPILYTLH